MKRALLDTLLEARRARVPVVVATRLYDGEQRILLAGDGSDESEIVNEVLTSDRCFVSDADEAVFYQPHNPPLRMALVGAVHIAQPLAVMARLAGYTVTVVDPREAFASAERFPGVALDTRWPDEALDAFNIDVRSAIVTLSHDPKLDDPALETALGSPSFYIGALGSRKTHASRAQRLAAAGFSAAEIGRIHAPVGLPIGARSAAEIAISVMGQVTETLRKPVST